MNNLLNNPIVSKQLSDIDIAITSEAQRIRELANQLEFVHIADFVLSDDVYNICNGDYNRSGVYFFEIKNSVLAAEVVEWIAEFENLWVNPEVIWYPGIKKGRVSAHKKFSEWIPMYIGKCKSVGVRINEHINQPKDRRTFSMKLKARTNLYGRSFRVSWIPLDIQNYDMIVPAIESALRDRYNPIIGRQ